jgi:Uncharacterized protein conserved in bacteria (DUF2330)
MSEMAAHIKQTSIGQVTAVEEPSHVWRKASARLVTAPLPFHTSGIHLLSRTEEPPMKLSPLRPFVPGALALAAAAALVSTPAEACGGFFCSQQQPVNQAAERIIFADNGDGTITAVIQILYEGPSEQFSWLLPISTVPSGDELGVASDIAFQRLQLATNPQFNLTTRVEGTCRSEYSSNLPPWSRTSRPGRG